MIEVNLFPWREYRYSLLKRQFYVSIAIATIITCVIIAFIMYNNIKRNQNQWLVNNFYQQQMTNLKNVLLKQQQDFAVKEKLQTYLEIMKKVKSNHVIVTSFFNGVTRVLPDHSYYTNISFQHDNFLLEGKLQSSMQLTRLLENIKAENWRLLSQDSRIIEKVEVDIFTYWFRLRIMA